MSDSVRDTLFKRTSWKAHTYTFQENIIGLKQHFPFFVSNLLRNYCSNLQKRWHKYQMWYGEGLTTFFCSKWRKIQNGRQNKNDWKIYMLGIKLIVWIRLEARCCLFFSNSKIKMAAGDPKWPPKLKSS